MIFGLMHGSVDLHCALEKKFVVTPTHHKVAIKSYF